jgi:hypothetical protein
VKRSLVLEPQWQSGDDRFDIWHGIDRELAALEGFDEGLSIGGGSIPMSSSSDCQRVGYLTAMIIDPREWIPLLTGAEALNAPMETTGYQAVQTIVAEPDIGEHCGITRKTATASARSI